MRPTLVIGLGGMGSQIVDEFHAIVSQWICLDSQDRRCCSGVACHSFDTAQDHDFKSLVEEIHCSEISAPDLFKIIEAAEKTGNIRDQLAGLPASYIPELNAIARHMQNPEHGMGTTRALGYLAAVYCRKDGKPYHILHDKIRAILEQGPGIETRDGRSLPFHRRDTVYIYLVSSAMGGTGSGMIHYLAATLRSLQQREFKEVQFAINLSLVLPGGLVHEMDANKKKRVRANAQACLREVNAYKDGQPIAVYNITGDHEWQVFDNSTAENAIYNQENRARYQTNQPTSVDDRTATATAQS